MFRKKAKWIYWREPTLIIKCKCSKCHKSYGCMDTSYCQNCERKIIAFKKGQEI